MLIGFVRKRVFLTNINPDGPAAASGVLQIGMQLMEVDGESVEWAQKVQCP